MASQSMYLQADGFSQAKQRRTGTIFRDQHGRRYHAVVELKTGHPTGPIEPQFQAPLMPPQQYLRVGTNPERPYDLRIEYDRWIADIREAHREYLEEARKRARRIHGDKYDPESPITEEIRAIIGLPPEHVEPVLAAKQGNAYVLGLTDRVDVRLYALLEEDRTQRGTPSVEPDFSQVVEASDVDEEEDPAAQRAEQQLEEQRARDRERKRRKREAARDAQRAAVTAA